MGCVGGVAGEAAARLCDRACVTRKQRAHFDFMPTETLTVPIKSSHPFNTLSARNGRVTF